MAHMWFGATTRIGTLQIKLIYILKPYYYTTTTNTITTKFKVILIIKL